MRSANFSAKRPEIRAHTRSTHHYLGEVTFTQTVLNIIRNLRIVAVNAVFLELPAFERRRDEYMDDEIYRQLQQALMENPEAGTVIERAGGVRKVRYADKRRGKGTRGGLRVIYYWWAKGQEFWLFTVYDKDEMDDLSESDRAAFRDILKRELKTRSWT